MCVCVCVRVCVCVLYKENGKKNTEKWMKKILQKY